MRDVNRYRVDLANDEGELLGSIDSVEIYALSAADAMTIAAVRYARNQRLRRVVSVATWSEEHNGWL